MTKETIEVSDSLVLNYELGSKRVYYMNLVETIADNHDNKLIAEFMGVYKGISDNYYYIPEHGAWQQDAYTGSSDWVDYFEAAELRYHSSWDWLMPVVEKIEESSSLGGIVTIVQGQCVITSRMAGDHTVMANKSHYVTMGVKGKLLATYEAVVEFIKWFNKEKEND